MPRDKAWVKIDPSKMIDHYTSHTVVSQLSPKYGSRSIDMIVKYDHLTLTHTISYAVYERSVCIFKTDSLPTAIEKFNNIKLI